MENLPFTSLLFWDEFHHKIFTLLHLENSTEISIKGHTSGDEQLRMCDLYVLLA